MIVSRDSKIREFVLIAKFAKIETLRILPGQTVGSSVLLFIYLLIYAYVFFITG